MHDTVNGPSDAATFIEAVRLIRHHAPTWVLGIEEQGSARSLAQGTAALAKQIPQVLPVALGLAQWAWQRHPLDQILTKHLAKLDPAPKPARSLALALDGRLERPGSDLAKDATAMDELLDAGKAALVTRHLLPRLLEPAHAPAWLALTWDRLLRIGSADLPLSMLEAANLDTHLEPLRARLKAEWAMLYLSPKEAMPLVESLEQDIFGLWKSYALAELALLSGDKETGLARLEKLWKRMSWHPQLTLKLHALLHPDTPTTSNLSNVAVLLYSWNKADLLESTLAALAKTDLLSAKIFVLDNGSTDRLPQVVRQAKALFPQGAFESVTLPINVGAPAARNWLLSLPAVRKAKWVAFLDDDVELPANWLTHLVSAAEANDEPDVVGCCVTSAAKPRTVQSADYHLLPPRNGPKTFEDYQENILVFDNCANDFDLGLFSYSRPGTSVSGCCHLLSMASVEQCGDFDIRFTPTQFDDLERDLRLGREGLRIHYAGNLNIRHIQHSSLAKAQSLKSIGHVFGNKIKLEGKYSQAEVQELSAGMATRLESDLARKEDGLLKSL